MKKIKIREHRGQLAESMETVIEIEPTRAALLECIRKSFAEFPPMSGVTDEDITIEHYAYDKRINWDAWMVSIKGYGVFGFTDGPVV